MSNTAKSDCLQCFASASKGFATNTVGILRHELSLPVSHYPLLSLLNTSPLPRKMASCGSTVRILQVVDALSTCGRGDHREMLPLCPTGRHEVACYTRSEMSCAPRICY